MAGTPHNDIVAELHTPLDKGVLVMTNFTAVEALGEPFMFNVEAVSPHADLDFDGALGKSCTVTLAAGGGEIRFFDGILTCARRVTEAGGLFHYALVLRPWLCLLDGRAGCRNFLDRTVTDIIAEVFTAAGFRDFEFRLAGVYDAIPLCVQYEESDLAFCTRLMERHGIWYFFEHSDRRHTLVMADTPAGHLVNPGAPRLPYLPAGDELHREHLSGPWVSERLFRAAGPHGDSGGQTAGHRRYAGGNAASLFPGSLVTVERHPVAAENRTFLVVRCSHRFALGRPRPVAAGAADGAPAYEGSYEFQPGDRPFRLLPVTPKPQIAGVQTAKVAGAPGVRGDAVSIDANGCIPVEFSWDRPPRQSCPVRIAPAWPGGSLDASFIPRAGAEVVIAFLDGDPDRPLVTGCMGVAPEFMPTRPVHGGTPALPAGSIDRGPRFVTFDGGATTAAGAAHSDPDEPSSGEASTEQTSMDETRTVGGSRAWTIKGDDTTTIQFGSQTINIASGNHTVNALQSVTLNVCLGSSMLAITPGAVTIRSAVINLNADTMINLNAPLTAMPGGPVIVVPGPITGFGTIVPPDE
jgi:type VI secretion system secreted protein VgrG